jgi:hypothetical protein
MIETKRIDGNKSYIVRGEVFRFGKWMCVYNVISTILDPQDDYVSVLLYRELRELV